MRKYPYYRLVFKASARSTWNPLSDFSLTRLTFYYKVKQHSNRKSKRSRIVTGWKKRKFSSNYSEKFVKNLWQFSNSHYTGWDKMIECINFFSYTQKCDVSNWQCRKDDSSANLLSLIAFKGRHCCILSLTSRMHWAIGSLFEWYYKAAHTLAHINPKKPHKDNNELKYL